MHSAFTNEPVMFLQHFMQIMQTFLSIVNLSGYQKHVIIFMKLNVFSNLSR